MKAYWDDRFAHEGKIWGEEPSPTAFRALALFQAHGVRSVLVPGSGYGRNTKAFSTAGLNVTGVEISGVALGFARQTDPLSKTMGMFDVRIRLALTT